MVLIVREMEKNLNKMSELFFGYAKKVLVNDPFVLYDFINKIKRPTTKYEKELFGISKSGILYS